MHWADVIAKDVVENCDHPLIATGISPTGILHVGSLREAITGESIRSAVEAMGKEVRLIYLIDDFDPLKEGSLHVELFGRGFAWLDTGNCDSLLEASNFVATIQNRQGFYVSCIEEIAWRNGWISGAQLHALGERLSKTAYGRYLMELVTNEIEKR